MRSISHSNSQASTKNIPNKTQSDFFSPFELRVSNCGSLSSKSPTDDYVQYLRMEIGNDRRWCKRVISSQWFVTRQLLLILVHVDFLSIIYSFYFWRRIKLYSNWYWLTIHGIGVCYLTVKPFADWWCVWGGTDYYGKRKSLNLFRNEENRLFFWKLPETFFWALNERVSVYL